MTEFLALNKAHYLKLLYDEYLIAYILFSFGTVRGELSF